MCKEILRTTYVNFLFYSYLKVTAKSSSKDLSMLWRSNHIFFVFYSLKSIKGKVYINLLIFNLGFITEMQNCEMSLETGWNWFENISLYFIAFQPWIRTKNKSKCFYYMLLVKKYFLEKFIFLKLSFLKWIKKVIKE